MATIYEYTVQINGCDFDFEDMCWCDEHYTVKEAVFDTLDEAKDFVNSITPEQVIEYERQTECNGLDVVIWKDELVGIDNVGWHYGDSTVVGEKEFVGHQVNGDWV